MIEFSVSDTLAFLITSGGILTIALAIFQLAAKEKQKIHYLSSLMYILFGLCILTDHSYRTGTEFLFPHLLYLNYPLIFLVGPIIILYFMNLMYREYKTHRGMLLFFIPFVVSIILMLPFYFQSAKNKIEIFELSEYREYVFYPLITWMEYLMLPWIAICFVIAVSNAFFLWKDGNTKHIKTIRIIISYLVLWVLLGVVLAYSDITDHKLLYQIGLLSAEFLASALFFIYLRYPDFFNIIRKKASQEKYRKSQLHGLNTESVISRIKELMEYDKIYTNNSLTLLELSKMLDISTHQLSEIINKNYKVNFNTFINSFRIKAACRLLVDDPTLSIKMIAYQCGFNSKTTFNTFFSKTTDMSPSQYRNKHKT